MLQTRATPASLRKHAKCLDLLGLTSESLFIEERKQREGKRRLQLPSIFHYLSVETDSFKNVIFKYMGPNSPTKFSCAHLLSSTRYHCNWEKTFADLVNPVKNANFPEHDFTHWSDTKLVKSFGKSCHIPQTAVQFKQNVKAVKSLCGQGDLCIFFCDMIF